MKAYICNCVEPDLKALGCKNADELSNLINNAIEIKEKEFIKECEKDLFLIKLHDSDLLDLIYDYPNDFGYYKNGEIYFFTHSGIEYFFK